MLRFQHLSVTSIASPEDELKPSCPSGVGMGLLSEAQSQACFLHSATHIIYSLLNQEANHVQKPDKSLFS